MSDRKRIELSQRIEGYKVYLEEGYGAVFVCVVEEGHEVSKSSWEALQTAMGSWVTRQRKKKKAKFTPIPLLFWDNGKLLPTNAVGIHAGTGNPLVKIEGHKMQQVSGYSSNYLRPMTETEQTVMKEMYVEADRATLCFKQFFKKFNIDHLKDWVKEKAGEA